jgi:ABC-type branched-subunit amino acid transport system substrate-binding protein
MRGAFESAVTAQGGTLAGTITYPATTTSFVREAEQAEKLAFDAIVLADAPSRVALIAPALAAAGIWSARESKAPTERSAVFLVPSFGFDTSLARSSRRYLQRAVFSVPFDAGRAPAFAEAFRGAFQSEPNLFAAAAYDSYRLLASALSTGASTREAVGKALAKAQLPDAASSADGFAATRGPRRPTRLETLSGDAFIEIAQ